MHQNFLEGLFKHRVLGPNPRFSESISPRISISKHIPRDTDVVVQLVRRAGSELAEVVILNIVIRISPSLFLNSLGGRWEVAVHIVWISGTT